MSYEMDRVNFPSSGWDITFFVPGGAVEQFNGAADPIVHDGTASFKMLYGNAWKQVHISGTWIIRPMERAK